MIAQLVELELGCVNGDDAAGANLIGKYVSRAITIPPTEYITSNCISVIFLASIPSTALISFS